MYISIYVCVYICIYLYCTPIDIVDALLCKPLYIHTYICMYVCMYISIYVYVYICILHTDRYRRCPPLQALILGLYYYY